MENQIYTLACNLLLNSVYAYFTANILVIQQLHCNDEQVIFVVSIDCILEVSSSKDAGLITRCSAELYVEMCIIEI